MQRELTVVPGLCGELILEVPQLGGQGVGNIEPATGHGIHEAAEQREFADQPRANEQVRVGPFHPGVRIRLNDRLQGRRGCAEHELGEVVRGVGHLGLFPAGQSPNGPGGGVIGVLEHGQDMVTGELPVGGDRREPPKRHVLQGGFPAAEQAGRDPPGGGGPIDIGEPPTPVVVRVVGRQAGILEERHVGVVQGRDGPPHLGREPRTGWQGREVERMTGQIGIDRGTPPALEGHEPSRSRHPERHPAGDEPEHRRTAVHLRGRHLVSGSPHHPTPVLGVHDEADIEALLGCAR